MENEGSCLPAIPSSIGRRRLTPLVPFVIVDGNRKGRIFDFFTGFEIDFEPRPRLLEVEKLIVCGVVVYGQTFEFGCRPEQSFGTILER